MKLILIVLISSILALTAAWYAVPYTSLSIRLNLFELYSAVLTIVSPCPTDKELTSAFEDNRKEFEELLEIIRKKAWSKEGKNTGRDIVRAETETIFTYDPWKVVDSLEKTTVYMNREEFESVRQKMVKCGVKSILKEEDGVVKFEFWTMVIPNMRLRKFLTHRDKANAVEDYESSSQSFGMSNESNLSPLQKVYFPKSYYSYRNMADGWGIEYGIM